mgnify:CR=1 FL=1
MFRNAPEEKKNWEFEIIERREESGIVKYHFLNKGGGFVKLSINGHPFHDFRIPSDAVGRREIFEVMVKMIEISFNMGIENGRKEFATNLREMVFYGK